MPKEPIKLKVIDEELAYLYLPAHPQKVTPNLVKKQVRLAEKVDGYKGPDIYLDFDESGTLVGIEIT